MPETSKHAQNRKNWPLRPLDLDANAPNFVEKRKKRNEIAHFLKRMPLTRAVPGGSPAGTWPYGGLLVRSADHKLAKECFQFWAL